MPPFFSIGFRPFFALGILFGGAALLTWGLFWLPETQVAVTSLLNPTGGFLFWHAHEMIFGFAQAIILGFLLTAVRNWTGLETTSPQTLVLILSFWVQARLLMLFGGDTNTTYLLFSQLATPLLGVAYIGIPIIQKRMWRNLFAPLALLVFALLDAISIELALSGDVSTGVLHAALLMIVFVITMIGGRIIPLFTSNKLGIKKAEEKPFTALCVTIPLLLLVLLVLQPKLDINGIPSTVCALILCAGHSVRAFNWFNKKILREPMIWSLHIFYSAIPLGFLFWGIETNLSLTYTHIHMLAIGAICGLIISMVSRVSLGHTGRVIVHDTYILLAFLLLITAFVARTVLIQTMGFTPTLITISGVFASASLLILFGRFLFVWTRPRFDASN